MDPKLVIKHFEFIFKWLNKNHMLTKDGIEIYKSGIDPEISLVSTYLTDRGNAFIKKYYDKYISDIKYGNENEKLLNTFLKEFDK